MAVAISHARKFASCDVAVATTDRGELRGRVESVSGASLWLVADDVDHFVHLDRITGIEHTSR